MPIQKHSTNQPTALQQALSKVRSGFFAVAVFSFFLNLPLFFLTVLTVFALLILGLLNTVWAWGKNWNSWAKISR
jgi:uncharacterized membrane protein